MYLNKNIVNISDCKFTFIYKNHRNKILLNYIYTIKFINMIY